MKAWIVSDKEAWENEAAIVFAETRGKAKSVALSTDACSEGRFTDLVATRCPEADELYKEGKREADWDDPKDRLVMVRDLGFSCEDKDLKKCDRCCARKYCSKYEGDLKDGRT